MGEGRQDQKAAPVKAAGSDPGGARIPGKAPPLPARANANGVPSPRAPQVAALAAQTIPSAPALEAAPVAEPGLPPIIEPTSSPRAASPSMDDGGISIPIDTEPPPAVAQSGDTARPPELAANALVSVPGPAPAPMTDPSAVDFDALHAALGEGSREAAPPGAPAPGSAGAHASASKSSSASAKAARPMAADSHGRSNATYASTDAKAPPVAHVDADLGAPAVIVAQDDVVPAYPPQQMTTPMAPPMSAGHPSSGPHAIGAPSSGGMRAAPSHLPTGNTPQAFDPVALGLPPARPGQVQLTMRMPERPRRPRTPTVVVRARGPSTKQKLFVFCVMLLLVSLIGLGIVLVRAPQLFGFGPKAQPAPAKPVVTSVPATATATATAPTASALPTSSAPAAPSASASAAASAKPAFGLKPKAK